MGLGLTAEELAQAAGISRAVIYRYEAGSSPKIETLETIADQLGVSLTTLLGVGVEYISSAVSFFERLRDLEEDVDQIRVLFGPISYLLTTDHYDAVLPQMLEESIPSDVADRDRTRQEMEQLISILRRRKEMYRRNRPAILSLVSAVELQQLVRLGLVGSHNPAGVDVEERREAARLELRNVIDLLRTPPIGVQVGVVIDSMPGTSFEILRRRVAKGAGSTWVAVSPFRLGVFANIRLGVATVAGSPDAVRHYEDMTDELWTRSLKGEQAADFLERNILLNSR